MGSTQQASIDPYAVFEALTGQKLNRDSTASTPTVASEDFEILETRKRDGNNDRMGQQPKEDQQPRDLRIGCISPYALVETMIGHKLDRRSVSSTLIISDVLQTDYSELFDLRHNSVLYAGLQLTDNDRRAQELSDKDMRILGERDLVTPDLSGLEKLEDLGRLGLDDMRNARINGARLQNGKLRLVVDARQISRTASNRNITETINDIATRYRRNGQDRRGQWSPPNCEWRNQQDDFFTLERERIIFEFNRYRIGDAGVDRPGIFNALNRYEDPTQGAAPNSWLVAAIFSVYWANPSMINRYTRNTGNRRDRDDEGRDERRNRRIQIRFHDKGGHNNNKTQVVEVDYEIPINNSSNEPVYCRAHNGADIWPALYEKAFAKWITNDDTDRPDITQTAHGDPIKAMAQINGRDPHYYMTDTHDAREMSGLVRSCSVNGRTINPMCAYTRASGRYYRGANIVSNHAYSVLGWCCHGDLQYIIVRNPFGVTEPVGLTANAGIVDRVDFGFWPPAGLCDRGGVLAVEEHAFKEYFQCLGVAR